jgi:hypothetical protein
MSSLLSSSNTRPAVVHVFVLRLGSREARHRAIHQSAEQPGRRNREGVGGFDVKLGVESDFADALLNPPSLDTHRGCHNAVDHSMLCVGDRLASAIYTVQSN